ncbi:Uncharacterised protein [Stutzerimonas stutzeri]|nr:Uncharacterised protein [Stutzerimonas stutzeri]CAB5542434.1 Uncharacterised protein [Stutzerimonas stutzeri]CAC9071626.1 Uncharacterised protein [Stutzerimonas stutzeri]
MVLAGRRRMPLGDMVSATRAVDSGRRYTHLDQTMTLTPFDQLLAAARQERVPQRLLFVFVSAELPADATEAERQRFEENAGGSLKPVLCVDKLPEELSDFAALREESERTGVAWDLLFAAALPGQAGITPNADEAEQPLKMMVSAIETGNVGRFLAFDRNGQTVDFY